MHHALFTLPDFAVVALADAAAAAVAAAAATTTTTLGGGLRD